MRNLTGYLKKILSLFSLVFLLLLLGSQGTHAEDLFTLTTDFSHNITDENISTEAIINISSETTRVLSYFTTTIPQSDLTVECYNTTTNKKLDCSVHKRSGVTDILVDFNNAIVKPDAPLKLKIVYNVKVSSSDSYNIVSTVLSAVTNSVVITYPKSRGEPLWTSDAIQNIKSVDDTYQISILKPIYPNISILFGKNVSYKFAVSRTFTNTTDQNQTFELIIPADSTTQTIVWDDITPLPNIAEQDEDGNYILKYILAPESSLDCSVNGNILKRSAPAVVGAPEAFLIASTGYWSATEKLEFTRVLTYLKEKKINISDTFSNIKEADAGAQELIYKYLYQYTVERLNPQQDLTKGIVTDSRIGFDNIVANPNNVTPSDYTDFLITILRKYGIPARQVIGYISNVSGYTSDGFYNYWVEAYDLTQGEWITMDPFLEDYSTKSLYKNIFYDHISILKRGKSPTAPKLTFYQDSDFQVTSNSQEQITPIFSLDSQLMFDSNNTISKYIKGLVNVTNTGNIAINQYSIGDSNIDNIKTYVDPVNNINSQVILPKQTATLQLNLPNNLDTTNVFLNIRFSNHDFFQDTLLNSETNIQIPGYLQIITKVISILSFAGIVYLVYFLIRKIKNRRNG